MPQDRTHVKFCCFSLSTFWANLLFATLTVVGRVGQSVTLPLLIDSANSLSGKPTLGVYFVVSFASLVFTVLFGLGLLFLALFVPGKIGDTERKFPLSLQAEVGICNGISGILIVFSSSGERTAPYLQAILGNSIIPLTIFIRYDYHFADTKYSLHTYFLYKIPNLCLASIFSKLFYFESKIILKLFLNLNDFEH